MYISRLVSIVPNFLILGKRWRRMRRAANEALSHKIADNYHRIQTIEAVLLTDGLFQTASSWGCHLLDW